MKQGFYISVMHSPWYDGYKVLLCHHKYPDKISAGVLAASKDEMFIRFEEHETFSQIDDTFPLDREAAQILMDELWHCGLRPSKDVGSIGELDATKKHLDDMRKLYFHSVKLEE